LGKLEPFTHTIALLGANGSITLPGTGDYYSAMGGNRIVGSVFTDQAGTLLFHWSSDMANNDIPDDSIAIVANTKTAINVEVKAPFCQVVYTNGAGGAQTVFRLFLYIVDSTSNKTVT